MSTQLIAHLKKKCEADDNVKILLSQWEFDQKLVGKALENIGGFYPHFSNHNASHSQQILVNIERLLGEDIELLTATDTWLILEAAYWHDAGMLVDAEKAKKVHDEDNFKKMLRELEQNKSSDLHEFAKTFLNEGWQGAIALEKHPFDGVEKYRQLIAEYFRKEHANRIGNIVLEDYKNLGINTPRTELLPTRLFRYLGNICVGHGMHFEKMMEVLPRCQTGLGTEDCHPLFVACLLRLGDLFDLDDNRFCPVMAKHVSNMPSVSKHHHNKHLSLREFQLDKRTVKLVAECPDEMSYVETQNWFGWIREEFQNQMSQWNLIVANPKFGSLPTIEQLEVRMEVKYDGDLRKEKILLKNKPMKFTIDEKNGIEILQGANLYNDKFSIFRELIQNAIDATMLRVWVENKNVLEGLNPYDSKYLEIIKEYQISISLQKKRNIDNSLDTVWELSIKDNGLGISQNDLFYMQNMAGSYKNIEKNKIINEMPAWMRPSGKFGIGLHSAFLLLDENLEENENKIRFRTCSYLNNETLEIEMFSPLGGKQGYCFINKIEGDSSRLYGTEILLIIKRNFVFNLRGIGDSNFKISWNAEDIDKQWSKNIINAIDNRILSNSPINYKKNIENFVWDSERCVAYKFDMNDNVFFIGFRGQRTTVSHNYHRDLMCGLYIDYYDLDPSEVLNISRDRWKDNFSKIIKKDIFFYMEKYISKFKDAQSSLLKKFYKKEFTKEYQDDDKWKEFNFKFNNIEKNINDLNGIDEFYILNEEAYLNDIYDISVEKLCNKVKFFIASRQTFNQIQTLIEEFSKEVFPNHSFLKLISDQLSPDFRAMYLSKKAKKPFQKVFDIEVKWVKIAKDVIPTFDHISIEECFKTMKRVSSSDLNLLSKGYMYHEIFAYSLGVSVIRDSKLLKEYKLLCFNDDNEVFIINPYQIIDKKIQLTNLEDLSLLLVSYLKLEKEMYEKILNSYRKLQLKIEKELKEYLE